MTWRPSIRRSPNRRTVGILAVLLLEATRNWIGSATWVTPGKQWSPREQREVTGVPTAQIKGFYLGSTTSRQGIQNWQRKQTVGILLRSCLGTTRSSHGNATWVTPGNGKFIEGFAMEMGAHIARTTCVGLVSMI